MKIPNDVLRTCKTMCPEEYNVALPNIENIEESVYIEFLVNTDYVVLKLFEDFIASVIVPGNFWRLRKRLNYFFKNITSGYKEILSYRKIAREELSKFNS